MDDNEQTADNPATQSLASEIPDQEVDQDADEQTTNYSNAEVVAAELSNLEIEQDVDERMVDTSDAEAVASERSDPEIEQAVNGQTAEYSDAGCSSSELNEVMSWGMGWVGSQQQDEASREKLQEIVHQRINLFRGPMVEVIVGTTIGDPSPARKTWMLPKALLSHHSDFFRRACNSEFKEGIENRVYLPQDDPVEFDQFIEWMFLRKVKKFPSYRTIHLEVCAYIFADKIVADKYANYIMRLMHRRVAEMDRYGPDCFSIGFDTIKMVMDNTLKGSPLRSFFSDVLVKYWWKKRIIKRKPNEKSLWNQLFREDEDLRNHLIYNLGNDKTKEATYSLEKYLIPKKERHSGATTPPDAVSHDGSFRNYEEWGEPAFLGPDWFSDKCLQCQKPTFAGYKWEGWTE